MHISLSSSEQSEDPKERYYKSLIEGRDNTMARQYNGKNTNNSPQNTTWKTET